MPTRHRARNRRTTHLEIESLECRQALNATFRPTLPTFDPNDAAEYSQRDAGMSGPDVREPTESAFRSPTTAPIVSNINRESESPAVAYSSWIVVVIFTQTVNSSKPPAYGNVTIELTGQPPTYYGPHISRVEGMTSDAFGTHVVAPPALPSNAIPQPTDAAVLRTSFSPPTIVASLDNRRLERFDANPFAAFNGDLSLAVTPARLPEVQDATPDTTPNVSLPLPRGGNVAQPNPTDSPQPAAVRAETPGMIDLLVENFGLPPGLVDRALRAFESTAKPLTSGGFAVWSWLGISSWVVAAALVCENFRKGRVRPSLANWPHRHPFGAPEDEQ